MPIVIVRPAICGGAYKDPCVGWIDNVTAMAGFVYVFGLGLIHSALGNYHNTANLIPVDFVVNAIIAAAPYQANKNSLLVCHAAMPFTKPMPQHLII